MASYTAQDVIDNLGEQVGHDEKVITECTFDLYSCISSSVHYIGLSICHNFNMSPDSLRWKLEAISFSGKVNAPHSALKNITLDSVLSLKAQLQRDVAREKKAQARTSTVSANVNKMRMPAVVNRNINLLGPAVSSGRTVVAQVKQEEVQVAGPSRVVFSGPSRVTFSGLKQDDEGKTQRACERLIQFINRDFHTHCLSRVSAVDRYMFEKQMERSESQFYNKVLDKRLRFGLLADLDQMIDDAADLVRSHFKLDDIGDPGTTTDVCFRLLTLAFLTSLLQNRKMWLLSAEYFQMLRLRQKNSPRVLCFLNLHVCYREERE